MRPVAFVTVIFPLVEEFLPQFFKSLLNQTFSNFDVIIVNDGIHDFMNTAKKYSELNFIELPGKSNPAANRALAINHAIEKGYTSIVFGDADDFFLENRMEISVDLLSHYPIIVNDVNVVNKQGDTVISNYFSNRLHNEQIIGLDDILHKNLLGLSNTALNASILKYPVNFSNHLIAVDWYFFTQLLLQGKKAVFTNDTRSYYRQYNNNTVGIGKITKDSIKKAVKIKMEHYAALKDEETFQQLAEKYKELYNKITSENHIFDAYVQYVQEQKLEYPFWWEQAIIPENKK